MASTKLVLSFIITFFFIFLLLPFHAASHSDSQTVNLSVYYEALSPSCATFIVQNLARIFDDDLITITNLRMVPWGNARVNKTDSTTICQNGRDECFLHKIQACAINVWNDVDKYYALIHCIEFLVIEGRHSDWQSCFNSLGLSEKTILECSNNGTGAKIQALYGYETAHLDPPHMFLPWVVVNYKSLGKDYRNFTTYICNEYKGKVQPDACKLHPPDNVSSIKEQNPFHPV
ncbi:GAMMA-INTERFERON INDUCIBLE LYSOSOMAL THIOL REDUCTASE GILT [Salix koriyanagi]|uniref:GAMMA-INTERFERON INDUCIBLE LYSOSOMAL THIOL REDUCTASE GILT n=1 Tax=Salix koriyanagi TaxID=2511006 RepID=A0A9Q0X378_9ROSI|nr:GAMMA-INTERFERON INDUCIBLE LYSOSOMAL THIOL REDUCTASE GILT [Salix koriyanagi]